MDNDGGEEDEQGSSGYQDHRFTRNAWKTGKKGRKGIQILNGKQIQLKMDDSSLTFLKCRKILGMKE